MSYKNYYRYRKMMANGGPGDPPGKKKKNTLVVASKDDPRYQAYTDSNDIWLEQNAYNSQVLSNFPSIPIPKTDKNQIDFNLIETFKALKDRVGDPINNAKDQERFKESAKEAWESFLSAPKGSNDVMGPFSPMSSASPHLNTYKKLLKQYEKNMASQNVTTPTVLRSGNYIPNSVANWKNTDDSPHKQNIVKKAAVDGKNYSVNSIDPYTESEWEKKNIVTGATALNKLEAHGLPHNEVNHPSIKPAGRMRWHAAIPGMYPGARGGKDYISPRPLVSGASTWNRVDPESSFAGYKDANFYNISLPYYTKPTREVIVKSPPNAPVLKPTPERSASSIAREVKRDELTQEMKAAGFTGYSVREVLKPGSDAAKAWEAFQNKDSNPSTSADKHYLHEPLKLSEKDANQEFHTDEEGTWGNLEDIWNFRRVEKPVTEKPITEKPAPVIEKPTYPKSAPEGYTLVKGWTGGDGVSYGDYYTYSAGAKDLDKYPDIPAGLPKKQYGGPIETPWFMPDVYANGGTVDGDPPLTWKNNKDYIQGIGDWGIASDVPITNRQSDDIKRKLRTGKYGYDPSTGTLNRLNENDWGTISAEDAPYVNQAIAHANRTPEEQQAFEKAKQENEYKKFKSGKQRVKIDQFTDGFKGKKIGDVAHLTDEEYNNYLTQWDKNSYDQISKGMLWNTPGMVATAGLLPNVGVLPGVIPGVAAGANEFYQGNPGKGALYTGLSLLPGIPPAYQGIKKGVSTTTTPLGKNLIATDFPSNKFARKHLTNSKSDPLLKVLTKRHPDITNLVRSKDGFSLMKQNPTDKSYYFNAYMTNPRDAGKAFKHFESKLPPGALVKNPSTSTLSDDSFGFLLNRTKNKNYTPEITGESVYLNPYSGKSMGEVSGIKSSGNVTKIDGNSVMTFPNKKEALKHAKGINAKIDKANFNTKKVSAEVVPVPGSLHNYAIKVPNIGIRNTPKPTSKGVPAVNTKVPPKGDEPYLGSTQSNLTKEESILNSFSKVKKPITKYDPAGNIVRESKIPQPVPKKLPWEKWNPETVKDEAIMAELKELERTVDMPNFNTFEGESKRLSESPLISKFAAEKGISENEVAQMQYLMSKTKAYKKFSEDELWKTFHGSQKGDLRGLNISENVKSKYNKGLYQTDDWPEAYDLSGMRGNETGKIYHLGHQKKDVLDLTGKVLDKNGNQISLDEIETAIKKYTDPNLLPTKQAAYEKYAKNYNKKVDELFDWEKKAALDAYATKETIPSWMLNSKGEIPNSIAWPGSKTIKWTKSNDKARPKNLLGNKGTFDININDINQALLPIVGAGALGAGLSEKALGGFPMMAHGGNPQYEAEGGEVIQGKNPQVYNGGNLKQISEDSFKIEGNSHENGGVAMSGGDYVYSDRIALDNNILSQLDL